MKRNGFILLILLITGLQLNAQPQERDTLKEAQIEKQLAAIDPELVRSFKNGTIAMDQGKYELADSLYSIVYAKAPEFDPLLRRLGMIKYSLQNKEEGIKFCREAVDINRSAYNLLSLAYLYVNEGDQASLNKAYGLLTEAIKLPGGDEADFQILLTNLDLLQNDMNDFRIRTGLLKTKYPDHMMTHYYSAILAANDSKWSESKKEILKAQELGLSKEAVDNFMNSGIDSELKKQDALIYAGVVTGIWLLGLLLLFVIGKIFSGLTLSAIENNKLDTSSAKPGGWLRTAYRTLINIGGVYYYISLPVVLILIVALTGGIIYLFLMAGRIPVKLVIILVIGAVVTIFSMIRSLLIKVDTTDPGRELKREEAPGLFELTEEVARIIGTRPVDEIRITPLNDLAVYEKGTWREKMNDKGKRILILGTAVLNDFKKGDFKAVLAHEYGHFAHRDTAGGDVAIRVQNDMTKYFIALYKAEQNTVWNIAFHFLRLYNFIFRRISHGATRLQEVLADRVAAETFGPVNFVGGLTHVIKSEITFQKYADAEIKEAIELKRPVNNLYALSHNFDENTEQELAKILNSKTTEDDTHPSPVDRFRYIDGINSPLGVKDNSAVRDLFRNWNDLTEEMTRSIEAKVDR